MAVRTHYLIFKGDDIAGSETDLVSAKKTFNALPPQEEILDGRAIYKLVKEDKWR